MELAMIDFNLPLGLALLVLCAAITIQALRLFRQGRHAADHRAEADPATPSPDPAGECVEIDRASAIDQAHQQALQQALAQHQAELAEAQATIARASDHVRRAGLTFAVTYLWDELEAGCALVDGAEFRPTPDGAGWLWHDATWQISREAVASIDPGRPLAHYSVVREGETLLTIACQRDSSAPGNRYRFVSVETLEMGDWVAELVDFAGTLRTNLELSRARQQVRATLRAASRIRLDGPAAIAAA